MISGHVDGCQFIEIDFESFATFASDDVDPGLALDFLDEFFLAGFAGAD